MAFGQGVSATKGRITVPARQIFRQFLFNPAEITDEKQINWGTIEMPGASHPVYQFASGGKRTIRFELYLDGDRGRFAKDPTVSSNITTIQNECNFYRSLVYPMKYDGTSITQVYPGLVVLTIGKLFQRLQCVVTAAPVKYTYFTPDMEPIRAIVSLTLEEIVAQSQVSEDIFPSDSGVLA